MIIQGYVFSDIASMMGLKPAQLHADQRVDILLTDSRKLLFPEATIFFAISSPQRDASMFILPLYEKGVRCFVTDKAFGHAELSLLPEANIIYTENVLESMQRLAAAHRHRFSYPVIGITGSNGKTIVKEWLYHLLQDLYRVVQSPKSYNSQVGVPLSVWQMNEGYDLGIFEAGISQQGEMAALQKIIDPTIGILTYIGEAHAKGFSGKDEKIREKLLLFRSSRMLIYPADDPMVEAAVKKFKEEINPSLELLSWGRSSGEVRLENTTWDISGTTVTVNYKSESFTYRIPFSDEASVSNSITCLALMLHLGIPASVFAEKTDSIRPVEMRLELKEGVNDCSIINDSYSADFSSLSVAMDFLEQQQQHPHRTVILSDFMQSGQPAEVLYSRIASIMRKKNIYRLVGVGPRISSFQHLFEGVERKHFFESTDEFLHAIGGMDFSDETILLKGARVFRFEKISHALQKKMHETVLEINLHSLRHNYKVFRRALQPGTRMMAMVKAFSYGSGSFEVANLLQHAGVDYLAVAYADEGVELRKNGITLPIMVMNPEEASFNQLLKYDLEPEIYSFEQMNVLRHFLAHAKRKNFPVHIEMDSGMHRLGFMPEEADKLCASLQCAPEFLIKSVFSHLVGSDDPVHDDFTRRQAAIFEGFAQKVEKAVGYEIMKHISNSGAIYRHIPLQYNMVRLGIGLYGIDSDPAVQQLLQNVTTLKTTVAQVKMVPAGDSIGYSRASVVEKDTRIAVVRIGYADGYPRVLSNGKGKMLVNGIPAPVIGNVCMDMTMLDVTGMDVSTGDEVVVFGEMLPVTAVSAWAGTIAYEMLTGVSQRVRRVYFEE